MNTSNEQQQFDSLLQTYEKLSESEQRILQVLAVAYEPILQTDLRKILQQLGSRDKNGMLLADRVDKSLREDLLNKNMLSGISNRLTCHPLLVEVLAYEAVDHDIYAPVVALIDSLKPLSNPNRYYQQPLTQAQQGRQLRHAFYQKRFDTVLHLLGIEKPFQALDYAKSEGLIKICTTPLMTPRFDTLPPEIKFQVLGPTLNEGGINLRNCEQHYSLLERYIDNGMMEAKGGTALLLAEQRLLRGKLDGAEALLAADQSSHAIALSACLHCLRGEYDTAITLYENALKAKRKGSRKRNIMITGLPGIFYVLALLQTEEKQHLATAQKQLDIARKSNDIDDLHQTFLPLADLLSILKGSLQFEVSRYLGNSYNWNPPPFFLLFRMLATTWLGEKVKKDDITDLASYCDEAYQAGLHWYACESALLLGWIAGTHNCEIAGIPAPEHSKEMAFQSIVGLLQPKPIWQRALLALKDLHEEPVKDISTPTENERRMVWWLNDSFGSYQLSPREQKIAKNGRWSKGRAVSLKRLCEEQDQFDYLTEYDLRICNTIRCAESWGYYGSTCFELPLDTALLAATGHPHLYWPDSPATPVELVHDEPQLVVQRQDKHFILRLNPYPERIEEFKRSSLVIAEGPHRLRVVQFSEKHLHIAEILGEEGLKAPLHAKEQILESISSIAPILTVHSDIPGLEGVETGATQMTANSQLHLHLQPAGEGLRLEWYVKPFADTLDNNDLVEENNNQGPLFRPGEGGITVFAEIDGKRLQTTRDLQLEKDTIETLISDCALPVTASDGDCVLENDEFALEVLLKLQSMGDQVALAWPKGKKIKLGREQSIEQFKLAVHKERDWFALEGKLKLDNGDVLAMEQLLALIQQSPGRFIRMEDGQFLALTHSFRNRLDAIASCGDDGRFHRLASHTLEEICDGMEIKACKAWKQQLRQLDSARKYQPIVPSTLQAQLRDYQLEGYLWLARLAHWGAGACLADDMGLGKTVQGLALILNRAADGPTLVLAPTSVCMNWLDEAQRFAPTLNVFRFGDGDRQKMLDKIGPFDLLVCSYGLLQNEAKRLADVQWHTIVADEAQAIKNVTTKRSKAAMALQGDFKMITTGTPIENHLGELWSLFHFINPGLLGSLDHFNQRFATAIENNNDLQAKQQLRQLIRPFILRRLKTDVLSELPSKTEITLHIELSDEESAFYEALRRQALERLSAPEENAGQQRLKILAEIMRLRRACCNPKLVLPDTAINSAKLKAFGAVVSELIENRHKALVFSQFVGHLGLIRDYLDEHHIDYQYLDGSTPVKQRRRAVEAFQRGEGELFLISLKAGGSGLNLTAADYVIHMDPWWNPAVEDQASDRSHRIGQQRPVTIYRMVAKDTIEEKIVSLHQQKRDLANSLLEGSEMSGKMSVDDMFDLIKTDMSDFA